MESHYEINVALNGRHLFATAPRSCVTREDASRVYSMLVARFPVKDGFSIETTRINISGTYVPSLQSE